MAQVHYWELSNYNSGNLIGQWFDLDDKTEEEHQADIADWLTGIADAEREVIESRLEDLEAGYQDANLLPTGSAERDQALAWHKSAIELAEEALELVPDYEEWILGDAEGVPSEYVGEWSIASEFFELQSAIANSNLDYEVFEAGIACGIPIDSIANAYYGYYESDTQLAEDYADSVGLLDAMPENLRSYFDFEAFGRDLAMDFSEHDGHYFHANW